MIFKQLEINRNKLNEHYLCPSRPIHPRGYLSGPARAGQRDSWVCKPALVRRQTPYPRPTRFQILNIPINNLNIVNIIKFN